MAAILVLDQCLAYPLSDSRHVIEVNSDPMPTDDNADPAQRADVDSFTSAPDT